MVAHALDNPIWESLASRHRSLALRQGDVARYPVEVAPFLGVATDRIDAATALEQRVPHGDTALLPGPVPSGPVGWELKQLAQLAQMVCPALIRPTAWRFMHCLVGFPVTH